MVRYGAVRSEQYGTVRYRTVCYGTVQYNTVWYSTVRYGTEQYGTVRYGTVRYGTSTPNIYPHLDILKFLSKRDKDPLDAKQLADRTQNYHKLHVTCRPKFWRSGVFSRTLLIILWVSKLGQDRFLLLNFLIPSLQITLPFVPTQLDSPTA